MDIVAYEKRMAEIDESINKCNEELDSLHEKRNQFWQEQMRLKKAFNLEKLKGLNLVEGNVVIGVSKMRDYHFTMIEAYTILHNGGINHVETICHTYRCDDFDYSYKTTQKNINLEKVTDMIEEFDVYVMSVSDYKDIIMKMSMLEINIDNIDDISTIVSKKAIKQLS